MRFIEMYKKVRYSIRDGLINRPNRAKLKNKDFTIICNDCTAGCICKDLKVRMNSPTRNFYFNADDYVKFCENLRYYLSLMPSEYEGDYHDYGTQYLMASLGDLKLFLVHYNSIQQFKEEWDKRRKRVNWDNIFFVMNDRNFCTKEDINRFCALPYPNKVFFSHHPDNEIKEVYYLKGSEEDDYLKSLMDYKPKWGIRRYYDQFDWVTWLNTPQHYNSEDK